MPITLPYLMRTGSCRYWIRIFFGWSIFPDKMKTTYIAIFPAYKLVTSTACPYPNFAFFVRFLRIWKAIRRYILPFQALAFFKRSGYLISLLLVPQAHLFTISNALYLSASPSNSRFRFTKL